MDEHTDGHDTFIASGWLLADLMLGIAIIFLVAASPGGPAGDVELPVRPEIDRSPDIVATITAVTMDGQEKARATVAAVRTQVAGTSTVLAEQSRQASRATTTAWSTVEAGLRATVGAARTSELPSPAVVRAASSSILTLSPTPCIQTVRLEELPYVISPQGGKRPLDEHIVQEMLKVLNGAEVGLIYTYVRGPEIGPAEHEAELVNNALRQSKILSSSFTNRTVLKDGGFVAEPYGQVDFEIFLSQSTCANLTPDDQG